MMNKAEQSIARLKESKSKALESLFKAGEVAGTHYAMDHAEWSELDRLERWNNSLGTDHDIILESISFRQLADEMDEHAGGDIDDLVREANGNDIDNPAWLKGFVTGALTKFDQLKPGLD